MTIDTAAHALLAATKSMLILKRRLSMPRPIRVSIRLEDSITSTKRRNAGCAEAREMAMHHQKIISSTLASVGRQLFS